MATRCFGRRRGWAGVGAEPVAEADELKQFLRALVGFRAGDAREFEREADVGEALRCMSRLKLGRSCRSRGVAAELALGERAHIRAVHRDGTAGWPLQEVDAADERGLARAGEADDEDLACLDVQRDIFERVDGVIAGAEGLWRDFNFYKRQGYHPE